MLDAKGCGTLFLKALAASFSQASGVIGTQHFSTSAGVRQGASTSCPLFTFFIDPTVDAVAADGPDGWLGNLHSLLLMDDTVIFATSRKQMEKKLRRLKQCTDDLGMVMHPSKSKFMVVNDKDTNPFILDEITISLTSCYVYLGTLISINSISAQVIEHIKSKTGHVMKFFSFLSKNTDAPFSVKRAVWDSAMISSIFYSCETWITSNLRTAETVYMRTLKALLGVRGTTCKETTLIEVGVSDAKAYIRERQRRYLHKLSQRTDYSDSYIGLVIAMAINRRTPAGRELKSLMVDLSTDCVEASKANLRQDVTSKATSRRIQYLQVNPDLSQGFAYVSYNSIPERHRIAYTRIRLGSHRLRIETGRWSRLPLEQRTCPCGEIQSEEHVLLKCPTTAQLRAQCMYAQSSNSLSALLSISSHNAAEVCKYCYDVLNAMT